MNDPCPAVFLMKEEQEMNPHFKRKAGIYRKCPHTDY